MNYKNIIHNKGQKIKILNLKPLDLIKASSVEAKTPRNNDKINDSYLQNDTALQISTMIPKKSQY